MPRKTLIAAYLVLVGTTAGCVRDAASPDSPAGVPSVTGSAPTSVVSADASGAVPGTLTCQRLSAAVREASLMDPGVVDGIVTASSTADAPVADAAERLGTAYAAAVAAKGSPREPDAVAAVSVAAADMDQVCEQSGLETVG